jgi:hypothetical protein
MIHTIKPCGLSSEPDGRSAIRSVALPPDSALECEPRRVRVAPRRVSVTALCSTMADRVVLPTVMNFGSFTLSPPVTGRRLWVTLFETSSWYFDRLQHRVDDLGNLDAFHLEVRPQQHAVLQHRACQCLYVFGQDEIAFLESRERARGRQ